MVTELNKVVDAVVSGLKTGLDTDMKAEDDLRPEVEELRLARILRSDDNLDPESPLDLIKIRARVFGEIIRLDHRYRWISVSTRKDELSCGRVQVHLFESYEPDWNFDNLLDDEDKSEESLPTQNIPSAVFSFTPLSQAIERCTPDGKDGYQRFTADLEYLDTNRLAQAFLVDGVRSVEDFYKLGQELVWHQVIPTRATLRSHAT